MDRLELLDASIQASPDYLHDAEIDVDRLVDEYMHFSGRSTAIATT